MPDHGAAAPHASPSHGLSSAGRALHTAHEGASLSRLESNGRFQQVCAELDHKVSAFMASKQANELLAAVQDQMRISLGVIADALQRYRFDELCLSYNGGKDCLVLLILYLVGIHRHFAGPAAAQTAPSDAFPTTLKSVYIKPHDSFPQVTEFVNSSSRFYHLDLLSSTRPMREAFAEYLQHNPEVKTILVGTRRTDPHGGKLSFFDMTDGAWPRFMRCHPVIDWHYREIWGFIRHFEIPYCPLYDLGYTSLGGTSDTHPNPALRAAADGGAGSGAYRPAYELTEDVEERLGRDQ